jgi:hypothetical protein
MIEYELEKQEIRRVSMNKYIRNQLINDLLLGDQMTKNIEIRKFDCVHLLQPFP